VLGVPPRPDSLEHRRAFGRSVRSWRLRAGWSQERLADEAGLHRTYVGGVERGERNVSLDAIWQLATALDLSAADLFTTR
jgi:transcriptional regulator with XRE-family HTH domain